MFFLTSGNKGAPVAAAVEMRKLLSPFATAIAIVVVIAVASVMGGCSSANVKDTVEDYTWEELSTISAEIAAASSEEEAIKIAKKYNLVNDDGTLDGTQTKSVTLTDGTVTSVQIAGFLHDDKSDGSGKAGITFIFTDAIAEGSMSSNSGNSGGWKSSDMRSWLASEGMALLPEELQDVIVAASKHTNNVGGTESIMSVTTSSDELWLFSWVELSGELDESYLLDGYEYVIRIINSEGSQYKLFSDCGVDPDVANDILAKEYQGSSCIWWGRTPTSYSSSYFAGVDSDGDLFIADLASGSYGVVPGFCI